MSNNRRQFLKNSIGTAATASLAATQAVWVNITTTGFTINTNGAAVGASTSYKWNYVVIQ